MKEVAAKNVRINQFAMKICAPLVAENMEELLEEIELVHECKPDIVEWRVDYYTQFDNPDDYLEPLKVIHEKLPDYPIVLTVRNAMEGGYNTIERDMRLSIYRRLIPEKLVDFVDFELDNDNEYVNEIMALASQNGAYTIVSYHDFEKTPDEDEIVAKLYTAQTIGANIAKIAVTPNSADDLLMMLSSLNSFNMFLGRIPLIGIAMGKIGAISRVGGALFGSVITYGTLKKASAPGQLSVKDLHTVLDILNNY